MTLSRPAKSQYSESEAAAALGVSVDELRTLIRNHIVTGDDEMKSASMASFQPADLLLLRILSGQQSNRPT